MSAGIGCTNKIHSSSTVRRSVDREMYRIPRDEPKSYWEKLRLKQCAGFTMVGRHVWIACIVCIFIIAANSLWRPSTLIPGDTDQRPTDEWCWKDGAWWQCQEVAGKQVNDKLEPPPRSGCHGGVASWGVCSRGRFLCRSNDAARWQWPFDDTYVNEATKEENVGGNFATTAKPQGCALFGGQFLCKDTSDLRGFMCLDNATSTGICPVSEALCCPANVCPTGPLGREREILRSRLAKLMEILFVVRPKEVLMAVREKGFPLLAYQSLLAVWGGLMHTSTSSNTSWEHEAMRGSWAIQSIDRLVQEVLGRFARTEEIRELAPRMARGWKAEGVFAGCNYTGREGDA